jgi:quinohemoprotein ethanol dehydrogenase
LLKERIFSLGAALAVLAFAAKVSAQSQGRNDDVPPSITADVLKSAGTPNETLAGTWLSYGRTQGETRYSPLREINTSNVNRLGLAWSYVPGAGGGNQEATPLVWNNTIYGITNWSVVFALDARTGKERWRWDPEVNQAAVRPKLCCGIVNRGLAIYNGMIFAPVVDGRLVALDALSGTVRWEARVAYTQDWLSVTMAPRVAGGKVLIGVAGGDHPTRGFFDAYDAATGYRVWRFYTVPGDPSKPFENEALRTASRTWSPDFYKMGGGGAVWDGMAFDPDTGLVYVGTGNAEPWVQKFRGNQSGENGRDSLYTCSILAVELATGQLRWHYQTTPDDNWDYDSVQQLVLADLIIGGRQRKAIMQASKNGFFYVLDRVTGEFLSAAPFTQVNWAHGVDKSGRPLINPEAFYGKEPVTIFPTAGGAHNWSPMSFNPSTGLVYIPTTYGSWTYAAGDVVIAAQTGHTGLAPGFAPGAPNTMPFIGPEPLANSRGVLEAWDPVNQKLVWRTEGGGGIGGGTVTTAGNLVFQTINDGRLLAYTADKGEKLLEIHTGRFGLGPPITYQVDGRQYVALMGGSGRQPNVVGPNDAKVDNPPMLLVFELDGKAPLPEPSATPGFSPPPAPLPTRSLAPADT